MLQRIQTIYLFVVITMLIIASFFGSFFEYVTDEALYEFNGSGIFKLTLDGKTIIEQTTIPIFILTLAIALFASYVMFSYKRLGFQLKLSRILAIVYILLVIGIVVWYYLISPNQVNGNVVSSSYSMAFFVIAIGLPFTEFAFSNIRKDKKKIDSLNRLR